MLFGKDYVFFVRQSGDANSNSGREAKQKVFDYIEKSLDAVFFKRKIKYVDYYEKPENAEVFTVLATFEPHNKKKKKKILPLLYELYAVIKGKPDSVLNGYKLDAFEFGTDGAEDENVCMIKVIKIKM